MADLSVTASSVVPDASAKIVYNGRAGEALAQGKQAYYNSTTKKWMLADANAAGAEARAAKGTVLNAAALNQPVAIATDGKVDFGSAIFTAGTDYYLSDTPGGICPIADVGTGEYVCRVGVALSASVLDLDYKYTGVQK